MVIGTILAFALRGFAEGRYDGFPRVEKKKGQRKDSAAPLESNYPPAEALKKENSSRQGRKSHHYIEEKVPKRAHRIGSALKEGSHRNPVDFLEAKKTGRSHRAKIICRREKSRSASVPERKGAAVLE